MADGYILAIDQGTTGTTTIIFDHDTNIIGRGYNPIRQIYPRPGLVEHDPVEIWNGTISTIQQAMSQAQIGYNELAGIGITNQRETVVLWERETGRPIGNAIVWQDRRTLAMCERLKAEGLEAELHHKTGLVLDPYFSATKVAWLLENVDGLKERAKKGEILLGTIDSWLIWNLTGGKLHLTDMSNASRTLFYNIHELKWDEDILNYLGIPISMLPDVRYSSFPFGEVQPGLLAPDSPAIPIAGVAGDQQAALFGQAGFQKGELKITYGTGAFLMVNTGTEPVDSQNGLLTTIAWGYKNKVEYALEGSTFIAGAAVQWLRDELKIIGNAAETEQMAVSVPDNGGVYIVPAFVGLGAPYWDSRARGAIFGLTRGSNRNHLVRAALESIAYQTRDVVEAMKLDSNAEFPEIRVDGGAVANNFLMQFQADMMGIKVIRPKIIETTALGAAFLAGLTVNYWDSQSEIARLWKVDREFESQIDEEKRNKFYRTWKRAVERSLDWEDD
ncbi:MAG: glycerol kinase GlpK [Chloroflexi bacterium]|uniref:Glycerol kinase n=1 Tax=Candidatus Chlorohelix allophototropha TaxID=3003348 RepID=A0A8T7M794_9CHLR|nr:glycerol kinase GlpK [Chloroflexota bacterium]WJW69894.1 glycerol kinase GlpK [Chloroflexota bacterium L227-S17]